MAGTRAAGVRTSPREKALELLSRCPGYERLAGERPAAIVDHRAALEEDVLSPVFEQAVAHTGFALDLFKARADRDGAALVLLHSLGKTGDPVFARLHNLAEARGIPVISQYAWIER